MTRTAAHTTALATVLADLFIAECEAAFDPDTLDEIRARNATAEYGFGESCVCATHDFADANMLMLAAFEAAGIKTVLDYEEAESPHEHEAACRLWSEAWSIAAPRLTDTEAAAENKRIQTLRTSVYDANALEAKSRANRLAPTPQTGA